ncbi:la protein homolog [Hyposmocoma kahamanoa]|uniref:la protein homolog n=1 Tax=Hyposmocoma kahamanoa TaxID=1477025 RepID=UPI000E6D8192|nr:la protein homolog [Hyposmocoma kahamanoa]
MTEQEVAGENGKERENNAEDETELESAIIQQVEYYFGDMNLARDKFLREQIKLDDGWVPLDVLARFNRLAKLSKDAKVIANALSKSTSGIIELSEDNQKIRRSPEMPVPEMNEERRKELQGRTVYTKGLPKDSKLDELLKFFKQHGDVENIVMRKYLDRSKKQRIFKGSVFVTFKNKEQAVKFLENKDLKYGETDLLILSQEAYFQKKQEEYSEKKEKRDKKHKQKEAAFEKEKEELKLPKGTVLYFSEAADTTKRENIKEALVALEVDVAYIDFKVGDTKGWVRLAKENAAKEFAEKFPDGKVKIGDADVVFKLLEDDEETEYLKRTVEDMVKKRHNQKNFSKQFKHKGGYKGKQSRKRKQDQHGDEPSRKVKADC